MVEKSHSFRETDSGAVSPSDRSTAGAVKPDVRQFCASSKEARPIPTALQELDGQQVPSPLAPLVAQMIDEWNKALIERRAEDLAAFGSKKDCVFFRVDVGQSNPSFTESAPLGHGDLETNFHPSVLSIECKPDRFFLFDRDLMDLAERLPTEAEAQAWVHLAKLAADSLIEDQTKHLYLGCDRAGGNRSLFARLFAPRNVGHDCIVVDAGRNFDAAALEEILQRLPRNQVARDSDRRIGITLLNPRTYPHLPLVVMRGARQLFFFIRSLGAKLARSACILTIVPAIVSGLAGTSSSVRVALADRPELRVFPFDERCQPDTTGHQRSNEGKPSLSNPNVAKDPIPYGDGSWVRIPPPPLQGKKLTGHQTGRGRGK